MEEYFWTRVGDADSYHRHRSLRTAIGALRRVMVRNCKVRWVHHGLATPQFAGNNYISFYPGDKDAQPTREISEEERLAVEAELNLVRA